MGAGGNYRGRVGAVLPNCLRAQGECVEFTVEKRQGIIYRISVTCAAQGVAALCRAVQSEEVQVSSKVSRAWSIIDTVL